MLNTLCNEWNKGFEQLHVRYNEQLKAVFFEMRPHPLPSFTLRLLQDIHAFQQSMARYLEQDAKAEQRNVEYLVFCSETPNVFQLGGDLAFFVECITSGDRDTLAAYAHLSIDVLFANYDNLGLPVTTISLVNGTALGAGFEAALSSDYIVAERQADFQFPEVVFNMFPGQGAYSFLSRRLDTATVENMILNGTSYNAEQLAEKGLVNQLADQGEAMPALERFIRRHRKTRITQEAVLKMRKIVNPVTKEELMQIADLWVDSAFSLTPTNIKAMTRIVKAQTRHLERSAATEEQTVSN